MFSRLMYTNWFRQWTLCNAILCIGLIACGATNDDARGALYGTTLEECNRTAKTLCQSITCENYARAGNGRMARELPASCNGKDGRNDSAAIATITADAGRLDTTTNNATVKDSGADHE